jgi:hypothetical protein
VPVRDYVAKLRRTFPASWDAHRDYRLYDERRRDLGPYYVTWSSGDDATLGEGWNRRATDDAGVLLTQSREYWPVDIFQYGLQCHADWLRTGDPRARRRFVAQAEWAACAQTVSDDISGLYTFPTGWKRYACEPGFRSAMAQGQAISLLLRAYQVTEESRYLDRAIAASSAYFHTIEKGGVSWHDPEGGVVFEEAAALPPSHILNGWIYALWGLFELSLLVEDPRVRRLYDDGLATLRRYLHHYDGGAWSYYSLLATPNGFRKYATLKYHGFHIAQLQVLASMTGDEYYASTALRWRSFLDSRRSRYLLRVNALAGLAIASTTRGDTVPGGARSVV